MFLINPVSENQTIAKFNTRKSYKAYIDFGIFTLYFIAAICKSFRFASTNVKYTNADLAICQDLCLNMKIVSNISH